MFTCATTFPVYIKVSTEEIEERNLLSRGNKIVGNTRYPDVKVVAVWPDQVEVGENIYHKGGKYRGKRINSNQHL